MAISTKQEHTKPSKGSIPPVCEEVQKNDGFRPIHYLGSKLRALRVIEEALSEVSSEGSRVMDLFAGSGTVAQFLSRKRPVTAVDIQEYSRVLCSALLYPPKKINPRALENSIRNSEIPALLKEAVKPMIEIEGSALLSASQGDARMLCALLESGSIVRRERERVGIGNLEIRQSIDEVIVRLSRLSYTSVITRHYGGIYFSYQQAIFIDAMLNLIRSQSRDGGDLLLSCLLSTASHIVNSVGKQFAQPVKLISKDGGIKHSLVSKVVADRHVDAYIVYLDWVQRYSSLGNSEYAHQIKKADYIKALNEQDQPIGVVYADPPYTRDHYSRFYHVLETISQDDDPVISTVSVNGKRRLSRGLYREDRYQSPFCIRSQAPGAFEQLFKGVAKMKAPLVLSYSPYSETQKSHPRVVTIDLLGEIGARYFGELEIRDVSTIIHSKLNRTDLSFAKVENSENLLIFTSPYHKGT